MSGSKSKSKKLAATELAGTLHAVYQSMNDPNLSNDFSPGNAEENSKASGASSFDFGWMRDERLLPQLRKDGVTHPEVLEALRSVPRHRLVPRELLAHAYENRPLPIGQEQTISQPTIVGLMSQWAIEGLDKSQRTRVFEVGTGSGYQSAVLSELFDQVYTMEVREELAKRARRTLAQLGPRARRVHCTVGDGSQGLPAQAPFDAILVTAAAPSVPPALLDQLRPNGGRLIIPVGTTEQLLLLIQREDSGGGQPRHETKRTLPVRFVPLVSHAP